MGPGPSGASSVGMAASWDAERQPGARPGQALLRRGGCRVRALGSPCPLTGESAGGKAAILGNVSFDASAKEP